MDEDTTVKVRVDTSALHCCESEQKPTQCAQCAAAHAQPANRNKALGSCVRIVRIISGRVAGKQMAEVVYDADTKTHKKMSFDPEDDVHELDYGRADEDHEKREVLQETELEHFQEDGEGVVNGGEEQAADTGADEAAIEAAAPLDESQEVTEVDAAHGDDVESAAEADQEEAPKEDNEEPEEPEEVAVSHAVMSFEAEPEDDVETAASEDHEEETRVQYVLEITPQADDNAEVAVEMPVAEPEHVEHEAHEDHDEVAVEPEEEAPQAEIETPGNENKSPPRARKIVDVQFEETKPSPRPDNGEKDIKRGTVKGLISLFSNPDELTKQTTAPPNKTYKNEYGAGNVGKLSSHDQ